MEYIEKRTGEAFESVYLVKSIDKYIRREIMG